MDAHFYVFSHWTLKILEVAASKHEFTSLKGEFVPYLISLQIKSNSPEALNRELGNFPQLLKPFSRAAQMSGSNSHEKTKLGCFGVFTNNFCCRVNTIQTLMEQNREIPRLAISDPTFLYRPHEPYVQKQRSFISDNSEVGQKSTIAADSVVGSGTVFGEKVCVKQSNLGMNCKVGNNVKITNSLILEDVVILDG